VFREESGLFPNARAEGSLDGEVYHSSVY
jgi:hypothetical protein